MVDSDLRAAAGPSIASPPLYRQAIPRREALWEKLRQGLRHRLVIVQASTGHGKTAFLADFARQQNDTNGIATAWLTVDRVHQDRIHLLRDLALVLQVVRPGIGSVTHDALCKTKDIHRRWDYFLELFCREAHEADGPPALVILDQYERIVLSPGARDIVDHLASALSPGLTLLLSTRQPPGLASIPRLRTQEGIFVLSASDFCFAREETRELLSRWLGFPPADEVLESVWAKTGGWPAGVQMAGAFAARRGEKALLSFSGSQPELYEHLCQEVFERSPGPMRSFLTGTALVDEVSPALAQALAGDDSSPDTQAVLWDGDYPGLVSETETGILYHHNPVFHNFLLKKVDESLTRQQLLDLRAKLAEAYKRSHEPDASLYHLLEAADYQRAAELVASLAEEAISSNCLETLARWLDAFPREERNARPWLLLYEGVICRVNRDWEKALSLYNLAADAFRGLGEQTGLARTLWYASQVLTYRRNQRLATLFASEALTYLDPSELRPRAWILHSMGNSYFDLGQAEEALRCHEEALGLFAALGEERGQLMQSQAMAWALHRLGRLNEAQQHYVRALDQQATSGDLNMLCWLQAGLAHLRAMRGDYSDSMASLNEVVDIARGHHLLPAEAFALSNMVDIHLDLGEYAEAETCYWQAVTACEGFDDDAPQIGLHLKRIELERHRGQQYFTAQAEPAPAGRGSGGVSPQILPLRSEPALSLVDWIEASNLEITKIAHDLQKSATFLVEKRYDEAAQRASEARNLSSKIGARYHHTQAGYLLARICLLQGKPRASAQLVEELLSAVEAEGYTGFLLRDPEATGELLINAFRHSPAREQISSLLLKLVGIREEVATPLLCAECPPGTDKIVGVRNRLMALGQDLVTQDRPAPPRQRERKPEAPDHELPNGNGEPGQCPLDILLLGALRVRRREHLITDRAWRTCKAKELFAYLLTFEGRTATRDQLLEVLWPELSIDAAVSNFHFTLHSLRRALEPHLQPGLPSSYLVLSGRHYSLQLPGRTWIDMQEFKTCVSEGLKQARAAPAGRPAALLERAVELYHGDFLADLYVDWVEPMRRELLDACQDALRHLASLAYACRDYEPAIRHARAMLVKDSYVEDAHRLIMRAACETGNSTLALRQYEGLLRLLHDELDALPEIATQQLYRQIREGTYQRT